MFTETTIGEKMKRAKIGYWKEDKVEKQVSLVRLLFAFAGVFCGERNLFLLFAFLVLLAHELLVFF
jgi:hypothetical protein